jgi:hypothetical protein
LCSVPEKGTREDLIVQYSSSVSQFSSPICKMLFKYYLVVLGWIIGNHFVSANSIQLLNAPRALPPDNLHFLPRPRSSTPIARRGTVFKNSTTLDKSWSGAVLFSLYASTPSILHSAQSLTCLIQQSGQNYYKRNNTLCWSGNCLYNLLY